MNGQTTISAEDNALVSQLKKKGLLVKFDPNEFRGATRNGGVAVMCSDGDVDIPVHHMQLTHRPHCLRIFGGPLLLAQSFPRFNENFAIDLSSNLQLGMEAKDTKRVYLYVHAPCGVAHKYNLGILEQLKLAVEARDFLAGDSFFDPDKIFVFFHVKRINKAGVLEQNTYKIAL